MAKRADPNQSDYNGRRALLLARQIGLMKVVQLLVDLGAYIDPLHGVGKLRVKQEADWNDDDLSESL